MHASTQRAIEQRVMTPPSALQEAMDECHRAILTLPSLDLGLVSVLPTVQHFLEGTDVEIEASHFHTHF